MSGSDSKTKPSSTTTEEESAAVARPAALLSAIAMGAFAVVAGIAI